MNKNKIGFVIILAALFFMGVGIGLKTSNSAINTNVFTIVGLAMITIGFFLVVSNRKKSDEQE